VKACRTSLEPAALSAYRAAQPAGTWDAMRDDALHGGQRAYAEIKSALVRGQRGLCAYCELRVADGLTDAQLDAGKQRQGVEHFHSKRDTAGPVNWALHWPNLWAVCLGGSRRPPEGEPLDPGQYLPPLPGNLSCDKHKDHRIQNGDLDPNPDGWILAPHEVPAFPRLFQYAPDGTPEPDPVNCGLHAVPGNRHADTATLVSETIRHLNLGCARLNRSRRIARAQLEKQIQQLRQHHRGAHPQQVLLGLARRIFSDDPGTPWASFFTLIRWRLGESAEQRLREMGFEG
jgi:uncharacterized protein (TIGR02646 family)